MLRLSFAQSGSALGSKTAHWRPLVDGVLEVGEQAADRHVLPLRLRRRRQRPSRSDSDLPGPRRTQRVDAERGEAVTVASGQRVGESRRAREATALGGICHTGLPASTPATNPLAGAGESGLSHGTKIAAYELLALSPSTRPRISAGPASAGESARKKQSARRSQ